jgi:O-antigen/teichoic acid export membrane protein
MPNEQSLRRAVVKNASANLVRLAGSGIVALLLPPVLVRMLPTDTYSAWALLLQLTLYVGLLDFGIQTAVARFVAHADELHDAEQRDGSVSTAAVLLALAATLGFFLVAVLAWQLPRIFTAMPAHLFRGARIALLLMGGSFALGLPFSVIHAVFVGRQRNEIPAAMVIANRFALAALTVGVVYRHWGLSAMGGAVAIANVASSIGSYFAWRVWAPQVRIRISLVSRECAQKIGGYSLALAVWFAGMLMISGLDLTIVAKLDYAATAYYAVAATLTSFVTQIQGAIFSSLLPASAVLSARGDARKLGAVLISSTRYGMLILLATALPMIVAGRFILRVWVGADYATHSTMILQILVVANVVRLSALPYATLLLGTNQQRKVIMSPLAEGIVNLSASVLGAYFLGAIGVAIGTLVGSFVGVGLHLFHNMPRTSAIAFSRSEFVKQGLFRPFACAAPFLVLLLNHVNTAPISPRTAALFSSVAISGTGFLFWKYGLIGSERRRLGHIFHFSRAAESAANALKPANG